MSDTPLETLDSMGIEVEDEFKEAVSSQLRMLAYSALLRNQAPSDNMEEAIIPPVVRESLAFWVKPWGLVLVVRSPAIDFMAKEGGNIGQSLLDSVAKVAGVVFPAALVGIVTKVLSVALAAYTRLMQKIDKGNGVYLTLTWPSSLLLFFHRSFIIQHTEYPSSHRSNKPLVTI